MSAAVCAFDVDVSPPFLGQLRQFRLIEQHLIIGVIAQLRLIELCGAKIDPAAILAIHKIHILGDRTGKECLAVFTSDDQDDLPELPVPIMIHDPENHGCKSFLP